MAAVWEQDGGLRVSRAVVVPAGELRWRFSRSSGPGGQGVNTTDSRVELMLDVEGSTAFDEHQRARVLAGLAGRLVGGTVTVTASEHRSQLRNREAVRARLAALLAEAVAPPAPGRRATRPTRGSQTRRLEAKKRRSQLKSGRRRLPPTD